MIQEVFVPLHTNGMLNQADLVKECHGKRWMPLLALRPKGQPRARPIIPALHNGNDCRKWCNRHLPKHWVKGHYVLDEDKLKEACEENDWDYELWPSYKRIPIDMELCVEILYVEDEEAIDILGSVGDIFYRLADRTDILR